MTLPELLNQALERLLHPHLADGVFPLAAVAMLLSYRVAAGRPVPYPVQLFLVGTWMIATAQVIGWASGGAAVWCAELAFALLLADVVVHWVRQVWASLTAPQPMLVRRGRPGIGDTRAVRAQRFGSN